MFINLINNGYNEFITIEDVKSRNVNREDFRLSGWKIFGNEVLDYFYKEQFLDLYLNLYKYINFAVYSPIQGLEYSLDYPLLMYPLGDYSSHLENNQITFRPVEAIPLTECNKEQKLRTEKTGFVFFREIEGGATLTMDANEFLIQLRAPIPELTTMLHYLVEGKLIEFKQVKETDEELQRLWRHLEDTGII